MVNILIKCGYQVNNENGKLNLKINIADFFMFTIYFVLSIINLLSSNPSVLMFALNLVSIVRLIFKNYIDQSKIVAKYPVEEGYSPLKITFVHTVKIISETASLIILLIFIFWNSINNNSYGAIQLMAFIVLLINWLENIFSMFERLYDAQPIPLQPCQTNNS